MIKLWRDRHYGWSYEVYIGGQWAAGGDFSETEQDAEVRANEVLRWNDLMPDMTTTEAAQYLASKGYTVHSKKTGTDKPPASELVKRWCEQGKIKARKSGWAWLVPQEELDRLIKKTDENPTGATPDGYT